MMVPTVCKVRITIAFKACVEAVAVEVYKMSTMQLEIHAEGMKLK